MRRAGLININLNKVLFTLFCLYAFSMPFELILEILFDVDTIFKPFRVLSLAIIGVYGVQLIKNGFRFTFDDKNDLLLYLVFVYGIFISLYRIISQFFDFGYFYNQLFQTTLFFITYFIFKSIPLATQQALKILKYFMAGIIVNAFYIFNHFVILHIYGRQAGLTDNPNYASLGLLTVITFLVLKLNLERQDLRSILKVAGIGLVTVFLLYINLLTGCRTGLIIFALASMFIFFFASWRKKVVLAFLSLFMALTLIPSNLDEANLGGPLILLKRLNQSIETGGEDVRYVVWRGVFRVLEQEGYGGMGIGQFKANFPKYFSDESNKLILEMVTRGYHLSTHNDFLALLSDFGIIGLLLYLIFLFYSFRKIALQLYTSPRNRDVWFLAQFNFIIFLSLIIFGLTAENFQHQLFWFLLMFSTKTYKTEAYA